MAQKKQVVTELNGYLKKSYNFSDESEYARAYEDLRHMFTTGSRKSISGLFENAVKKTGSHDSVKTKDAEFQMFGPEFHHPIIKANSKEEAIKKAKEIYGWGGKVEAVKVSDKKTIDKAIRNCDRDPYEYESIKNDIDIAARGKASYITKSSLQSRITRGFQTNRLTKEQKEELWNLANSVKQ